MELTEIHGSMLPFYRVEVNSDFAGWKDFTIRPFATKELAEKHIELLLQEIPDLLPENARVAKYTSKHWRNDLIDALLNDKDAARRALSMLRTKILVESLKSTPTKPL